MKSVLTFLSIFIQCLCCGFSSAEARDLIPTQPGIASKYNYWCTSAAQEYLYGQGNTDLDVSKIISYTGLFNSLKLVNEKVVFGETGYVEFFPKVRHDLIFLLGDGYYAGAGDGGHETDRGTLLADPLRFPSFTGTPEAGLQKMVSQVKAAGWAGFGIWLNPKADKEDAIRNRILWSKSAGVSYWRIAGEDRTALHQKIGKDIYPALVLENMRGGHNEFNEGSKEHPSNRCDFGNIDKTQEFLRKWDVMRITEVGSPLNQTTDLDRVAALLKATSGKSEFTTIINVEDELYLGAALGCALGIRRHPQIGLRAGGDPDISLPGPRMKKKRMDEINRAVRWHRIAPPFAAGATNCQIDERMLEDSWNISRTDYWAGKYHGKLVTQAAPARISRGLPLPEVKGDSPDEVPYVIAARNPNAAISVATLARTKPDNGWFYPLADITINLDVLPPALGIFGKFRSLTIVLNQAGLDGRIVLAQDLNGDIASDITSQLKIEGTKCTIPGAVIDKVGLSAATAGDVSDPGLIIVFDKK